MYATSCCHLKTTLVKVVYHEKYHRSNICITKTSWVSVFTTHFLMSALISKYFNYLPVERVCFAYKLRIILLQIIPHSGCYSRLSILDRKKTICEMKEIFFCFLLDKDVFCQQSTSLLHSESSERTLCTVSCVPLTESENSTVGSASIRSRHWRQDNPRALPQEEYRPRRSDYTLSCLGRGWGRGLYPIVFRGYSLSCPAGGGTPGPV